MYLLRVATWTVRALKGVSQFVFDVGEDAGLGAELQQRDVLARRMDRIGLRLDLGDLRTGEPADQVDVVDGEVDDHADVGHARREGPTRVIWIDRMSSPAMACRIDCTAGLKRSTWPTMSVTPALSAASMIRRPSSTVWAMGFSTRTWTPRAMAASEMEVWSCVGRRR